MFVRKACVRGHGVKIRKCFNSWYGSERQVNWIQKEFERTTKDLRIQEVSGKGLGIFATKDIMGGSTVLEDKVFLFGPLYLDSHSKVCFSCGDKQITVDQLFSLVPQKEKKGKFKPLGDVVSKFMDLDCCGRDQKMEDLLAEYLEQKMKQYITEIGKEQFNEQVLELVVMSLNITTLLFNCYRNITESYKRIKGEAESRSVFLQKEEGESSTIHSNLEDEFHSNLERKIIGGSSKKYLIEAMLPFNALYPVQYNEGAPRFWHFSGSEEMDLQFIQSTFSNHLPRHFLTKLTFQSLLAKIRANSTQHFALSRLYDFLNPSSKQDSTPEMKKLSHLLKPILHPPNNIFKIMGTALFWGYSFMNHSCEPNVTGTTTSGFSKTWKALRDIKEGEEILTSYVDLQLTNEERKKVLFEEYGFQCNCKRCLNQQRQ